MNGIMQTAASTRWAGFHGLLAILTSLATKRNVPQQQAVHEVSSEAD
jgi:hypothetical protein